MTQASTLVRNPASEVRLTTGVDSIPQLIVSSYSVTGGFVQRVIGAGQSPEFGAVRAFWQDVQTDPADLSPADAMLLWSLGLIVVPPERLEVIAPARFANSGQDLSDHGFTMLHECMSAAMQAAIVPHYRAAMADGTAQQSQDGTTRYTLHNDPAGRIMLAALSPAVQAVVGRQIKPSYAFASLYKGGSELAIHLDRQQCKYTLSVAIDHQPAPVNGISPWPLQVHPNDGSASVECLIPLRGGILFRGQELRHCRPQLAMDQTCWTLLLHYVDAEFDGSLD